MPFPIACDLVGTIADMGCVLRRDAGRLFGGCVDWYVELDQNVLRKTS
jgi:hypothetical protein